MESDDRYTVISADCHAGADLRGYKPFLESRYHDAFDDWADHHVNPFGDLAGPTPIATGIAAAASANSKPTGSSERSSTPTPSRRSSREEA